MDKDISKDTEAVGEPTTPTAQSNTEKNDGKPKQNPMHRDPKLIKQMVRQYIKGIEKSLHTAGMPCKLKGHTMNDRGNNATVVLMQFNEEDQYIPVAKVPTSMIFNRPTECEDEIAKQIYMSLKSLQEMTEAEQPKEVII